VQDYTAGDALLSAVAMEQVGDVLREVLKNRPAPQPQPPKPEPQRGEQERQEQDQPGGDQPGGDQPEGDQPGDGPPQGDGEGEGEGEPQGEDWEPTLEKVDIERLLHRALKKAKDEAEKLDAVTKAFGLEPGEWKSMDPDERLAMAERLKSSNMRRLADMIGRMTRYAFGVKQTKMTDVPHVVYDVERGNNIRNVLPREYALMGQGGGARLDFYRRFAQGDLAQYRKRGEERAGKGPLVVAIDKSYSMDGRPFDWAMGAAEAMRRLVAEEGRDYHAIFFGGVGDLHHFDFPKGKADFETILAFCSVAATGGTDFRGPLTEALDMASKAFDDEGKTKADVVLISDGYSALSNAWIERFNSERKRAGVRVHAVFVNGALDASGGAARALLERISDQLVSVHDLTPESVELVFQEL
jgi:uncharacterized protein with von Willebrand factor type A (vWA) domain